MENTTDVKQFISWREQATRQHAPIATLANFPNDSPGIRFKVRLFATTRLIRIWRWAVGLDLGVHQSDHRYRKAYTWSRGTRDVDTQLGLFSNCSFFATRRLFPFRHLFGHGVLLGVQHGRVDSFQTLLFLFLFRLVRVKEVIVTTNSNTISVRISYFRSR